MDDATTDELGSLASALRAMAAPVRARTLLVPGTIVDDTYEIGRVLGVGGMGVVYAARDRRLGRDVALKLHTAVDADARARMAREAEALAKLAHPNVVAIHDVGALGDQLYLAMELVAGGTLRAWLARPHPRRAVLATLLAAGDGLAAAHARGLIHRDFKPDNVLVGADDRPRVADFGLAVVAGEAATGAAAGTPRYMAPEQRGGAVVDARADQFAFAATAWEALTGAPPFPDDDTRAAAIERGPAAPRALPGHVARALRRGLAADPAARFADLAALLTALRRDPRGRRLRVAAITGGVAAVALTTYALTRPAPAPRGPAPCSDDGAIAAIWNPARRAAVSAGFDRGAAWLRTTGDLALAGLDARAAQWVDAHRAVCRAAQVTLVATPAQTARARRCLDRRRSELDAAAGALTGGAIDARAVDVVDRLPAAARCTDPAQLAQDGDDAPPADVAAARAAATALAQLDRAQSLSDGGRFAEAQAALDAVADPVALALPFVRARAAELRASLASLRGDPDARDRSLDAFLDARRAGHLARAARVAVSIAIQATARGDATEAERWLRLADADIDGAALGPRLQAQLARARAIALAAAGRTDDAAAAIARALELVDSIGDDSALRRQTLATQATIAADAGRIAEAAAAERALVAATEARLGPGHPDLAWILTNLGLDLGDLGDTDAAIAAHTRAIDITRATGAAGPNRVRAERVLNLGVAYARAERWAEAVAAFREARAAFAATSDGAPDDDLDVALCDANLANALAGLGDRTAAVATAARAAATYARVAPDAPDRWLALENLAAATVAPGASPAALAAADRHIAQAIAAYRAQDDGQLRLASALIIAADIALARGRAAAAVTAATEAVALYADADADPRDRARAERTLARAR